MTTYYYIFTSITLISFHIHYVSTQFTTAAATTGGTVAATTAASGTGTAAGASTTTTSASSSSSSSTAATTTATTTASSSSTSSTASTTASSLSNSTSSSNATGSTRVYFAFDTLNPIPVSDFNHCFPPTGNYSYQIYRVGFGGQIDSVGVNNIVAARRAGEFSSSIDGWMDPRATISGGAGCSMIHEIVTYINFYLKFYGFDPSYGIRRIFLNVTNGFNWFNGKTRNVFYIQTVQRCVQENGLGFGIISNNADWQKVTGNKKKYNKKFSSSTLVWRSQGGKTRNDFSPFGPWTKPSFRQYSQFATLTCGNYSFVGDLIYGFS